MRRQHPCILNLQSSGNDKIMTSFWGRSLIFWKVMVIRRCSWQLEKGKCHTHLPQEQQREAGTLANPWNLCPWKDYGANALGGHLISRWTTDPLAGARRSSAGLPASLRPCLLTLPLTGASPAAAPPSGGARRGAATREERPAPPETPRQGAARRLPASLLRRPAPHLRAERPDFPKMVPRHRQRRCTFPRWRRRVRLPRPLQDGDPTTTTS